MLCFDIINLICKHDIFEVSALYCKRDALRCKNKKLNHIFLFFNRLDCYLNLGNKAN